MSTNQNPIFVVGVFRSGTSLLCSLLNQNPQIALMYECDVWNFPRPLLKYRFKRNWAQRIEFYNQALSRHRLTDSADLRGLEKIRVPLDLYRRFGEMKGAAVSGEKSPFYCTRMEQLHGQYPGAFFIFVWRNPAEVYRSLLKAGETSRFFARPGMLSRMIYQQEQAIQQAGRIEEKGARILRVDYGGLVDETEKVCRETSAFLGVEFDPKMLQLNTADLSAIYKAPHHAFLRRGIIERQKYNGELAPAAIAEKLERYRRRWEQQLAKCPGPPAGASHSMPGRAELIYHNLVGRGLTFYDSLVRAGFEFLPLPWLRIYRLLKNWVVNPPSGAVDEKTSLMKECREHWVTLLAASALLGLVCFIHSHTNPHLNFNLFYAIPCVLLALVVNVRWASLFVVACSFLAPIMQYDGGGELHGAGVFAWNLFTRFFLLEMIVLTIGRIRLEFSSDGCKDD